MILFSGYALVTHATDEDAGLLAAMLYALSDGTWHVTAGQLTDDGTSWSFSAPQPVAAGRFAKGDLRRTPAGLWQFSYVDPDGTARLLTCRDLAADGSGTWG